MNAAANNSSGAAEHDRYVFVDRPRCPRCQSSDLQTTRTETQSESGDDSTTQRKKCKACGHNFFVVWS